MCQVASNPSTKNPIFSFHSQPTRQTHVILSWIQHLRFTISNHIYYFYYIPAPQNSAKVYEECTSGKLHIISHHLKLFNKHTYLNVCIFCCCQEAAKLPPLGCLKHSRTTISSLSQLSANLVHTR